MALVSAALLALPTAASAAGPAIDAGDGAVVAIENMTPDRRDVFVRSAEGTLRHKVFQNDKWSGWEDLGGPITSAPAVASMTPGRLDVFAKGGDDALWHKWYVNGAWSGWESLGGFITAAPAVTSWGNGRLDVVARGGNNALFHRGWSSAGWSPWFQVGGIINGAPAIASYGPNRADAFVLSASNTLCQATWDGKVWSPWSCYAGELASAPSVASMAAGGYNVFAKGKNGELLQKFLHNGRWSDWEVFPLGNRLASAPAAIGWNLGGVLGLDIVGVDAQGDLIQHGWASNAGWWSAWRRIGPTVPTVPAEPDSRTSVIQGAPGSAATGGLTYAFVDNAGALVHGFQPDPESSGEVRWTVVSDGEAFVGQPSLTTRADGRVEIAGHLVNGDVWVRTETAANTGTLGKWGSIGGWMLSAPVVGRQPDSALVQFAVDGDGRLYAKRQNGPNGAYGLWDNLGTVDLTGSIATATARDGVRLFVIDRSGAMRTALYSTAGALGPWTALGGEGLNGMPAVVVSPGFVMRVFARSADGTIVTKSQNASGAFAADWTPLTGFAAAGSPAALLSPITRRLEVVARGSDGYVHRVSEVTQASGSFGTWTRVEAVNAGSGSVDAVTDPTIVVASTNNGPKWGFVFRNSDLQHLVWWLRTDQRGLAKDPAKAAAAADDSKAPFTVQRLPKPQR